MPPFLMAIGLAWLGVWQAAGPTADEAAEFSRVSRFLKAHGRSLVRDRP
jgi:hypothetical protein